MSSFGVSWARAIATAALFVGALAAFPTNSYALNGEKYCSAGSDPTKTADTVSGSLLSVNDVKLWAGTVYTSSNCYGDFDPGNSSPANETAAINQIFGDIVGPSQFVYLDKTGDAPNSSGLNGIKFEVHTLGGNDGNPGLWTIVWTATGEATSQEFPLKIDLAVLLVGGNHSAAYLLSGILVPFSPGIGFGSFDIQFPNGSNTLSSWWCTKDDDDYNRHYSSTGGKNEKGGKHDGKDDKDKCKPNQPDLSHLLIAGRLVTTQEVPEPATMTMLSMGLVGLWAFYRRRLR